MAKRTTNTGGWLGFFSFLAVMLLGLGITVSVVLGKVLPSNGTVQQLADWIKKIAIAIGLLVPLFCSYNEARRHGTVWFVLWIVAVVLIVVFYILSAIWF